MAKKIVRGITDVKTITNQDFDTNNVNDLLSDGQYNYIHRKKGKTEEYHNLTDNIKTISSDNTELLTVTNNNKTTNTATLHPKHDQQKEQVLESTRDTIAINHGTNGTAEKTTVDTNPKKVLEHENLISDSEYITLDHQTDVNKTHIKTESLKQELQQLHQTKQDVLTAGTGITIEGQTISASGGYGFKISDIKTYSYEREKLSVIQKNVDVDMGISQTILKTFTFQLSPLTSEVVIEGRLVQEIEAFIPDGTSISNGAITISNDGTTIKVTNSNSTENVAQQGTFTFEVTDGGGNPLNISSNKYTRN